MLLELCIIIILIVTAFIALSIWLRNPLRRLHSTNPVSRPGDHYRQDRILFHQTKKCLGRLHNEAKSLKQNPHLSEDILHRLKLILHTKGFFKKHKARLYNSINHVRRKQHAGQRTVHTKQDEHQTTTMASQISDLISDVTSRIENLDRIADQQEKKMEYLIGLAQKYSAAGHYKNLRACIKVAKQFQNSNIEILRSIRNAEKKISAATGAIKGKQK
jgi:hypothetical protein